MPKSFPRDSTLQLGEPIAHPQFCPKPQKQPNNRMKKQADCPTVHIFGS